MAEWKAFQPPVPEALTEAADKMSSILKKFRTVLNLILTVLLDGFRRVRRRRPGSTRRTHGTARSQGRAH